MSESIQERIAAIATAMHGGDPTPGEIRAYEVTLAGLLWQVNKEVTQAELEFRVATLGASTHTKSAAAARMVAEAGPTYARLLHAKAALDSLMEMLRTCRSSARSISEEMRLQR
jgi:hypothetical protein